MNINEIAKLAGVSRATVSRYLNHGYVSQEKKERIRRVIEETGYQPSSQAQMLRTRKTGLVGVILPKINSDAIGRMMAGISDILTRYEYRIILANTNNNIQEELKYLSLFQNNQVDGVIFLATALTQRHKELLREMKVPVVILGQQIEEYSCVYQDDYNAAREITELLLKKGKNIAYIGVTEKDRAAGWSRYQGFEAALKKQQKECPREYRILTDFKMESGQKAAERLMREHPEIDSIFCATDSLAVGAMIYLKQTGIKIPQQVQVVGLGDTSMGKIIEPALTSVHFYYKTSGQQAAQMLIELIEKKETARKEIKMGYRMVVLESVR